MDTPYEQLPEKAKHAIMYGTNEYIPYVHVGRTGGVWQHTGRFKGVIANISKTYENTESENTRKNGTVHQYQTMFGVQWKKTQAFKSCSYH